MRFVLTAVVLSSFAFPCMPTLSAQDYRGVHSQMDSGPRYSNSNAAYRGRFPARMGNMFRVDTRSPYGSEAPASRLEYPESSGPQFFPQSPQPVAAPQASDWNMTHPSNMPMSSGTMSAPGPIPQSEYYEPPQFNSWQPAQTMNNGWQAGESWPAKESGWAQEHSDCGYYPFVSGDIFGVGKNDCCDEWAGHCQCLELTNKRSNCECTNRNRTKRPVPQRVRVSGGECTCSQCDRSANSTGSSISDYFHPKTIR